MSSLSELKKVFRDAATEAYDGKILFLEPEKFTGDKAADLLIYKTMSEQQFPGEKTFISEPAGYISDNIKDSQMGPFASKVDSGHCVISEPDINWDSKEKIISHLSDIPINQLKNIPGTDEAYIEFIAKHEASHCVTGYPDDDTSDLLEHEAFADYDGLKDTQEPGVVQTILHARAASAFSDPAHATNVVKNALSVAKLTGETYDKDYAYETAASLIGEINYVIGEKLHLDTDDATALYEESPELYLEVVDSMVEQGLFDADPILKASVIDFSNAEVALKDFDQSGSRKSVVDDYETKAQNYIQSQAPTSPAI